jgi:hypothetical protein
MKPSKIFDIMDMAQRARNLGEVFNPLFVGPPGVGKSQIVQAWAKFKNLPFIDLRLAYLEAPDLIGFPTVKTISGVDVAIHAFPEFWPQDPNWKGVILLEEPNRGTTSVMNCCMQLLTDRQVHKYKLPEGAIIVGCINPESEHYDVNSMDAALKDRFEIFNVVYDKSSFVNHMKTSKWHSDIIHFVENAGTWSYVPPEDIKNAPGSKYISPRTLSKLNVALKSGFDADDELMIFSTILGSNVGKDFYSFRHDESPVFYKDLLENPKTSLAKLRKFSDPENYKNGVLGITRKDLVDNGEIEDKLLVEVLKVIPVDQGTALIKELEFKRKDDTLLTRILKDYPEIKSNFKAALKFGKQTK